jgi:acetyl-CoA carboxylase biotin carboxyl carrier protein
MSDLTYQDVLNILRLIDTGAFSTLEIDFEGTRLKVSRRAGATVPIVAKGAPARIEAPSPAPKAEALAPVSAPEVAPAKPEPAKDPAALPGGFAVKPPMEGTFYAAPGPGTPPFVEVGHQVRKGDQLGIVEVMKLFTPVSSPCDGTVRAILVRNEQVVTKDQTLMVLEADSQAAFGQRPGGMS